LSKTGYSIKKIGTEKEKTIYNGPKAREQGERIPELKKVIAQQKGVHTGKGPPSHKNRSQ